jgi:DNA-binding IclR family transcriptional regulator
MLLSLVPEIQGRSDAGVSIISSGQAPPTTTIAAPPASNWRTAAIRPRGAIHSHATTIAGTTSRAAPIFVSKPSPTQTPASTSQRVRPS